MDDLNGSPSAGSESRVRKERGADRSLSSLLSLKENTYIEIRVHTTYTCIYGTSLFEIRKESLCVFEFCRFSAMFESQNVSWVTFNPEELDATDKRMRKTFEK